MIQVADVAAYGLGVYTRGSTRTEAMRQAVKRLLADTDNVILEPGVWTGERLEAV